MFITLSKILPLLIYPTGLAFLLVFASLFLRRKLRLQTVFLLGALLVIGLAGNRYVAYGLVRSLEVRFLSLSQVPEADAIVVLGGGTEILSPPRPIAEINGAGDRVLYAAELYRQGKAPVILATGGRINWYEGAGSTAAGEMRQLLLFLGVPARDILLEEVSLNTYENAIYSAVLLQERQAQRILLVTSAMHMPRAYPLFVATGLEVIPAPTDYILSEAEWQTLWQPDPVAIFVNLFPTAGQLNLTTSALKEYIGWLVYRLRGWL
jgi:uncharacterized SAM-binding protein YcdF (DUF218 family)